jgi:hypothetical protein
MMGGVVQSAVKPIAKLTREVTDKVGVTEKRQAPQQQASAIAPQPAAGAADMAAAREASEDKAARRRSRRRGQGLLSEARVNPEQGISTLGTTGL